MSIPLRYEFYPFQDDAILVDTEVECRVKLSIIIIKELVYELARLGPGVKVLAPQHLINDVTQFHRQAYQQYQD